MDRAANRDERHSRLLDETADSPATVDLPETGSGAVGDLPAFYGRYRIVRRLGEGGMGAVYEADDPQLRRRVAVKVPHFAGPPDRQERARLRFLREARAAAAVEHPNVCPIHDVGEQDGRPFVVMAYVDGPPLADRLRAGPRPDVREAVRLVAKVAAGLAAVHAHGIVHRDLKPGNILIRRKDGEPVLTDFGLAQGPADDAALTAEGIIVGTPAYMAPEQADPTVGPVTVRSDLYSLGVVLFELVTGRRPFEGSAARIIAQVGSGSVPPASSVRPGLDPDLDRLIAKATARCPEDRFATAEEFGASLTAWLNVPAAPAPSGRRPRWILPALATAGAAVLAVAASVWWPGQRPAAEPDTPIQQAPGDTAAAPPIRGAIDVRVWRKDQTDRPAMRLHQSAALPLAPGDWLRIEVELNRPAYAYVVWIDTEGKVTPLYPWSGPDWDTRPKDERPVERLSLPDGANRMAPLGGGPPGVETLLLLTRDDPLPPDADLASLFAGLPRQTASAPGTAAWFENGELVRHELDRGPIRLDQAKDADDPVLRTQALLKARLQPLFPYTRGVSFANRGD